MNDDIRPLISQLPEPAPPTTLTASVMARIAREADRETAPATAAFARQRGEWIFWLWITTGLAIVLGSTVQGWLSGGSLPDLTSPRIGFGGLTLMPFDGPVTVFIAIGVLVYLAGLFAPLRTDRDVR
jgi:hypothetical protein